MLEVYDTYTANQPTLIMGNLSGQRPSEKSKNSAINKFQPETKAPGSSIKTIGGAMSRRHRSTDDIGMYWVSSAIENTWANVSGTFVFTHE